MAINKHVVGLLLAALLLAAPVFALPPPGGGDDEGGGGSSATLSASPTAITTGQSSTLTWSSSGAASCTGTNFSTGGATSGSVVVTPTTSTTYTVTCSGASATQTVTVSAPPVPTASLSASPSSVASWQSSTLTWSSTNATSCTGTNFSTSGATSGTRSVSPNSTTTFTVSCTGAGGTATQSTVVTITADQGYTTTHYSSAQCSGGTAVGTYSDSTNSCVSYCAGVAASCCTTKATTDDYEETTFTCSAFSNTSATTTRPSSSNCINENCTYSNWSATLLSYAPAVTVALVANPSSVHTGDPALLTWSSTNATSCTGINFSTGGALSGSVEVSPAATTDYTLTCTNGSGSFDGTASDTERVTVENPGTLTVQCMPSQNPSTVYEPVTWESIVEGGYDYVYSWSGSDGLTGSTASVVKTYDTAGQKAATLSVTSTSPTSYQLVHQGYFFSKTCSGGENSTNLQQPQCGQAVDDGGEGFECNASTVGQSCKTTPGCFHDQVMYSWVSSYRCTAVGGEEHTVTTQCGDGVSCQYAMCTCDGPECGVEVEEGVGADLTVSEQPALYSGLNETGSTVRFIGTLRNIGNGTLDGTFANRFQVDIGSNGSYDLNLNVASAAYSIVLGGTADVVSPEWASVPAGIHAVRLCADTPSSIDETDETNNCGPELTLAVADPGAAVTIDAAQGFVRPGGNVLVTWLAEGEADSCTVSGPGLASSSLSGTSTVGILGESTFSILCSYDGVIMTDSVTVRIAPRFEEI